MPTLAKIRKALELGGNGTFRKTPVHHPISLNRRFPTGATVYLGPSS